MDTQTCTCITCDNLSDIEELSAFTATAAVPARFARRSTTALLRDMARTYGTATAPGGELEIGTPRDADGRLMLAALVQRGAASIHSSGQIWGGDSSGPSVVVDITDPAILGQLR